MRVTRGSLRKSEEALVKKVYDGVKRKFNFIDIDIVYDMFRVLENKESVIKQPEIYKKVCKEYKTGKISGIFEAYYARSAYARFLKMMCDSPHYPTNPNENAAFFAKMWELLAELWKMNLPQVNGIPDSGSTGGGSSASKALQTAINQQMEQLSKLVEYGQKVLELLKDPLFQKMFPQPGPTSETKKPEDKKEDKKEDSQSEQGDSGQDSDDGGDDGNTSPSNGCSSLDAVLHAVKTWKPFIVEAILFSHDLEFVSQINSKGEWAPTPFPDNSIDIHNMQGSQDLMKLLPGEFALPSDIFYLKYAKKELQCREFLAKLERKQILYILLDNSGSMSYNTGERIKMAASVVISLLRKFVRNGDIFYFRFFAYSPRTLYKVSTLKEAQDLVQIIIRDSFQGGGTNIGEAVMTALTDIKAAIKDKRNFSHMKDSQILLLTDGVDSGLSPIAVNQAKDKIKIHSVVIHGTDYRGGIKEISDTYYEVKVNKENQAAADIVKIFDKDRSKRRT